MPGCLAVMDVPATPSSTEAVRHSSAGTTRTRWHGSVGTERAPGRAWHGAPTAHAPPRAWGEIGLHRWHLRLGSLLLPLILSQPLITQTVSAADGETAPLPRILSSSHSNSRRCGGFLIRQRLGSGCCQLLLALGAKDHHPLMAPTSRMGAGICRQLHHSSLAPSRSWAILGALGEDRGVRRGGKAGQVFTHLCFLRMCLAANRWVGLPLSIVFSNRAHPASPSVTPVGKLSHGAPPPTQFGGVFSEQSCG